MSKYKESDIMLPTRVGGTYRCRVFKADTGRLVRDTGDMPNLITNYGLSRINLTTWNNDNARYCQVGTGNTAPQVTDTSLASYLATSDLRPYGTPHATGNSRANGILTRPYYWYARSTWRFNPGEATGNIQELGVGPSTSGNLVSRCLTVNESGVPTTVTVLADEYLEVTWTFYFYLWEDDGSGDPGDVSGTITLDGNSYDWLLRLNEPQTNTSSYAGWSGWSYDDWFDSITHNFNDSSSGEVAAAVSAGDLVFNNETTNITGSKSYGDPNGYGQFTTNVSGDSSYRTLSFQLEDANWASGIGAMATRFCRYGVKIQFTPAIPKTSDYTLWIRLNTVLSNSVRIT